MDAAIVSGIRGGGYIHPLPPEHHQPLYHYPSSTGVMSDGRTADGIKGETAVMGEGQFRTGSRGREKCGAVREIDGGGGEEGGGGVRVKTRQVN